METTILNVGGMSCGGCVKSVTGALQASAGVTKVDVDLQGKTAKIDYDPALTSPQQLAEAVEEIGFTASTAV